MPTIAELGFAVHSEPIDQAAESLDNLVDAGARAEKAVEGLAGASDKAGKTVSTSAREATAAVEKQADASKRAGDATGQFTDGLDRVGVSAKQTAAALRLVPAQLTDIVVGLQGGQAPLTVLLQQGGQLKDMFGGIGPAAKALGGYILGLVNPLTVAAAATAALGAAYYAGWKETDAFNKALILTGNSAGTSAGQLSFLAQSIGATVGTTGAAAEALSSLAASGKIASDNFELVTRSALELKENTGRAVEETIAEFAKIADDPVAAAKTLNEQYHFLTQSTYSQIAALKEQGDTSGATRLLTEAYADAIKNRSGEMTQNLGYVERAWRGIKDATLGALDAAKNIGRPDTLEGQRAAAQEKLNDLEKKSQNILVSRSESVQRERAALQAQLNILDLQIDGERTRTKYLGDQAKLHQDAITATQKVDAITKSTADNEKKRNDEIKEYKGLLESIRKDNPNDARLNPATVEKTIQGIRDKYKDARGITAPVDLSSFNDAENALRSLEVTFQNSLKVLDASQKAGLINDQEYALQKGALLEKEKSDVQAAYQGEIAALDAVSAKSSTTSAQRIQVDQKIADVRSKMVDALKKLDADQEVLSLQTQERLDKERQAIDAYAQALQDSLKRTQNSLDLQLAGFGLGDRSRQQLQDVLKIRQEYEEKFDKLERDHRLKRISDNEYDAETKLLQQSLDQRLSMQQGYYDKEAALRSDWMNGASRAFANYIDETKDVAGQTEGLFSDALHGVEDAFVNAATTGKLSFKDLADSIIADLARIVAKAYIVTPILAALGIGGDSAGGASSASGLGSLFGGGGGGGLGGTLSNISSVVSAAGSKFGQSVLSGWNGGEGVVGGLEGAFSNGADYFKSVVTSAFETGSTTAASIFTSETTSAALSQGYSNYAAQFGTGVAGQGAFDGALSSAAAQSSALTGLQTLSATLGYIQGVYTIFNSFKDYGLKGGAVTGGLAAAGAYIGSFAGPLGTAAGFAIGASLGALGAGKLFGGGEKYPDLSTSAQGTYSAGQYNSGGIVQGWQRKAPKFGAAVDSQLDATVNQFSKTLGDLYSAFGASTKVYAYDMLQVRKTSGKYSTTFGATIDGGGANDLNIHQQFNAADAAEALQHNYDDIMGTFLAKAIVSSKSLPEYFRAQFSEFANDWDTTADQVIKAIEGIFTRFNGVNDALSLIGVNNLKLDDTGLAASDSILNMIGAMNGLDTATASAKDKVDSLNKAVSTYYQAFFSADEQFADLTKNLRSALSSFGVALPDTRSAYRQMVEDINVTTAAGQAMFATLVGLATNADSYYSHLEDVAKTAADAAAKAAEDAQQAAAEAAQKIINGLMSNVASAESAVERAINAQKAAINDALETANKQVSDLTTISNSLGSALKSLRGESDEAVKSLRQQAQATLQAALAQARSGKSLAGFNGLDEALSVVSSNTTDLYASLEDFNRDQGRTANVVAELEKLNGKQLTLAERNTKALEDQLDALDQQLASAKAQLDALNGVDTSVISVKDAIDRLNADVVAALTVLPDTGAGSAASNTWGNNASLVHAAYETAFGRDADVGGLRFWTDALSNGSLTYDQLLSELIKAGKGNGESIKVPGYATGGDFGGGLRLVGENGPELEVTGPSRIFNANETVSMLKGGVSNEAAAEIRELRAEMKAALFAIAKNTMKAAKNTDLLPQKLEQELYV